MSEYYVYVTPSHTKLGVLQWGSATDTSDNWTKFTGDAKIIYSKYDTALTADTGAGSTPAFNSAYHMALVYKTLMMLGFNQFEANYQEIVRDAISSRSARKKFQLLTFQY